MLRSWTSRRDFALVELPAVRQRKGAAFTLIELLVVVAIIAFITAMLLPALTRARRQARIVTCASNMRQAFIALTMYAGDYKDHVWNYGPGAHDHRDPEAAASTPNNWAAWYENLSAPGSTHPHYWDEGLCKRSFWRGILIE